MSGRAAASRAVTGSVAAIAFAGLTATMGPIFATEPVAVVPPTAVGPVATAPPCSLSRAR